MDLRRQSSLSDPRSVEPAKEAERSLALDPQTAMHAVAQALKPSDKAQSSCKRCVEPVMEKEE